MKNTEKYLTTESSFPIFVASLSLWNIVHHYNDLLCLSTLLSLIGIASTMLYLKRINLFKTLIFIWVFGQLIIIDRQVLENGIWIEKPIWDLTQIFSLKLGFNLNTKAGKFAISVNMVPVLFFGYLKLVEMTSIIGKQLTFKKFKADTKLGDIFPLTGTIRKHITLEQETYWTLVELSSPFIYNGESIPYVLIKRKDKQALKIKAKNQIIFFRLVYDVNHINEGTNDSRNFPFVDWVLCE